MNCPPRTHPLTRAARSNPSCQTQEFPVLTVWDPEQRALKLQVLVHEADLSNPAREFAVAYACGSQVALESLAQGDREAALGLPLSPPCIRETMCLPKGQIWFIDTFLKVRGARAAAGRGRGVRARARWGWRGAGFGGRGHRKRWGAGSSMVRAGMSAFSRLWR